MFVKVTIMPYTNYCQWVCTGLELNRLTKRTESGRAQKSRSRNFLPLFATMFLGAFNDNFYKSALVILITYRLADASGVDARLLVPLASGILILPFLLCSALARQMADKYERSALIQKIKIAEIVVMSLGVVGFYTESVTLLMAVLFLMGAQSAFFGPLKYSVLPQHVAKDELLAANGLVGRSSPSSSGRSSGGSSCCASPGFCSSACWSSGLPRSDGLRAGTSRRPGRSIRLWNFASTSFGRPWR